jgi:hypothetical protein
LYVSVAGPSEIQRTSDSFGVRRVSG